MRFTFENLKDSDVRKNIPHTPGFYKVFIPEDFEVVFSEHTCAIPEFDKRVKEKIIHVQIEKDKKVLETEWEDLMFANVMSDRILYIGEGIDINKRIDQYKRLMFNRGKNHCGGSAICQIVNCDALEIEWYEYESDAVNRFMGLPREERKLKHPYGKALKNELNNIEREMIEKYCLEHNGEMPFANRQL